LQSSFAIGHPGQRRVPLLVISKFEVWRRGWSRLRTTASASSAVKA